MSILKYILKARSQKSQKCDLQDNPKPQSFAQKRALSRQNSLQKAQAYRKQLIKKEFTSPEPLKSHYNKQGRMTDVKIRKLKKS